MKIQKGDKFRVIPGSFGESNDKGKPVYEYMIGTVISVYPKHGLALLQLDGFREMFSFYGETGLYNARRYK